MTSFAYEVEPLSRAKIRALAAAIRALAKTPNGHFNIMKFVELSLVKHAPTFQLEVLSEDELGDQFGVTHPDAGIIKLREDIYNGARDGDGFSRMTVAHELGHFVMHSESKIGFARRIATRNTVTFVNSEWQANCFAGELLVPWADRDIIRGLGPDETAVVYGVSLTAARCQFDKFGGCYYRSDASALW